MAGLAVPALLGLVLLVAGGQLVVRNAAALAARLGLSPLVIGLVVVGFGTSAPELVTGARAALAGSPELAFGNAIGASLANLLLVLPVAVLIRPLKIARAAILNEGIAVLVACALMLANALVAPGLARPGGVLLILLLLGWLLATVQRELSGAAPAAEIALQAREAAAMATDPPGPWRGLAGLVAGVAALLWGADQLVGAALGLAERLEVAPDVLGLSLLALGTALPELATAIIAARARQNDIVVGNVLGSCLFNTAAVAGLVQLISGAVPAGAAARIDTPALLLAAAVVLVLLLWRQGMGRVAALALFGLYVAWLGLRIAG